MYGEGKAFERWLWMERCPVRIGFFQIISEYPALSLSGAYILGVFTVGWAMAHQFHVTSFRAEINWLDFRFDYCVLLWCKWRWLAATMSILTITLAMLTRLNRLKCIVKKQDEGECTKEVIQCCHVTILLLLRLLFFFFQLAANFLIWFNFSIVKS